MLFSQTQALALTRPKSELVLSLQNDSSSTSASGNSGNKDTYERQIQVRIHTLYVHFMESMVSREKKKSNEWKLATQNGLISILRWGREDIN